MKIRLSDQITDLSGSQSGSTYKRNCYGLVKQTKAYPKESNDFNIPQARTVLSNLSILWRKLTASERASWHTFAQNGFHKYGESNVGQYSGFTAFQSCNFNRALCTLPPITTPVLPVPPVVNISAKFTATVNTLEINYHLTNALSHEYTMCMFFSTVRPKHLKHTPREYSFIDNHLGTPPNLYNVRFQYEYHFGQTWRSYTNYILPYYLLIVHNNSGIVVNKFVRYIEILP